MKWLEKINKDFLENDFLLRSFFDFDLKDLSKKNKLIIRTKNVGKYNSLDDKVSVLALFFILGSGKKVSILTKNLGYGKQMESIQLKLSGKYFFFFLDFFITVFLHFLKKRFVDFRISFFSDANALNFTFSLVPNLGIERYLVLEADSWKNLIECEINFKYRNRNNIYGKSFVNFLKMKEV